MTGWAFPSTDLASTAESKLIQRLATTRHSAFPVQVNPKVEWNEDEAS